MAKEKLGLKSTMKESLGLSPKVRVLKSDINVDQTEKAVKGIHSATGKMQVKRVSLDMPIDLFKAMKVSIAGEQSTRDYILDLIAKDLNK